MHCAIIPARSGSKGLKDKNIKKLAGIPLIAYAIKAAYRADIFDEVFVSTDSNEYADIAKKYHASVPFLRDERYATDTASSWSAVKEAIEQYRLLGKNFTAITILQPTSPLRTEEDIQAAYNLFLTKNAKAIVSVCEMEHSPLWCGTLPKDNSLDGFILPEYKEQPRQNLPVYYRINGAIYMIDLKKMDLTSINLYQAGCYAYIMPKSRSVDIDDELDFIVAESIISLNKKGLTNE